MLKTDRFISLFKDRLHILKPDMLTHANAGPLARQIKNNGLITDDEDPLAKSYKPGSREARRVWNEYKPEVYALIGIFGDMAIQDAYENGLKDSIADMVEDDSVIELDKLYWHLEGLTALLCLYVGESLEDVLRKCEHGDQPANILHAYNRYKQWVDFKSKFALYKPNHSSYDFIISGLLPAGNLMAGMLALIPRLYRNPESAEELSDIARNSFPLIGMQASIHFDIFTKVELRGIRNKWKSGHSDSISIGEEKHIPEYYTIREVNGKKHLWVSEAGDQKLKRITGYRFHELHRYVSKENGPTVGCPLRKNFGNGSGIQTMWNWYLEVAEKLYHNFPNLKTQQKHLYISSALT